MSSLTATEILSIQKMIEKKTKDKGFIWNFSNATFKDFVESYTAVNIYDDKYISSEGSSKMKRLKMFLKIEEDSNVILILNGLKEYGKKRKYLCKTNIEELDKYIRKLKKFEKNIKIDSKFFQSEKKIQLLVKDINGNISKKQYELAIDRLHTLFKGYMENICKIINIPTKDKSLDALYGEVLKYIHDKNIFDEGTTKDILSSSKKIMKSFDYARNNRSYAHTNDIMQENEAEFLCIFIIDLYKFINKINWKKIL